jgi:acyl-CoA dehydrogenase
MPFFQTPPSLGNQYDDDPVLRGYLDRTLPQDVLRELEPELRELGEDAGGRLYRMQLEDRVHEPRLEPWDAWGQRVDRIEVTRLWSEARRIACERGLVATAYERRHGALSRVHQFALVYLFDGSTDVYTCPLAMTDGAARTLLAHDAHALAERALPRLTSRDPATAWTSGQWMTERTGGSDVGRSETLARPDEGGAYRLWGTKWFTSATTSEMALTLARVEGAPPGGKGLTLFYVETFAADGTRPGIVVNRLKDKLGTKKLPTAELSLEGVRAVPVTKLGDGVRNIAPMLNVTRTWNAVCSAASLRRSVALARSYARVREQFGGPLAERPLHVDTLASLSAEAEAAFGLAFRTVELLGREEAGEATPHELRLLRVLTPLTKLCTGKQAVLGASEALECFGGAGYVEDTGLPRLLRDAQVLSIWEGTTNVLALDALKVLLSAESGALPALVAEVERTLSEIHDARLGRLGEQARAALRRGEAFVAAARGAAGGRAQAGVEAQARRLAMTLARAFALALLVREAEHALRTRRDGRALAAATRFAELGVDALGRERDPALEAARALALGEHLEATHEAHEDVPSTVRGEPSDYA